MTQAEYRQLVNALDAKLISGEIDGFAYRERKLKLNELLAGNTTMQTAQKILGMDPGQAAADKAVMQTEKQLAKIYREAVKEMQGELKELEKDFGPKYQEKLQELHDGRISQQDFDKWAEMQDIQQNSLRQKIDACTGVLLNANEKALGIVNGNTVGVYAENANWQSYELERDTKMGLMFSVYDERTVERMLRENPELIPRKMLVDGKRDKAWNRKKISNAVTQSIIQGDSIPKLARRVAVQTGESNMKAMMRYARTAMTGAQNGGRMDTLHRAQGMGIQVKKVWLATLDSRTRDSHQKLDGDAVDIDSKFGNGLQYPGDLSAGNDSEVWNCRCTLTYDYDGFPGRGDRRDNLTDDVIDDMTYTEWAKKYGHEKKKKGKKQDKQEEPKPKPKDDPLISEDEEKIIAKQKEENEKFEKLRLELRDKWNDVWREQSDLENQIRELDKLNRAKQMDLSIFDRFDSMEEYDRYMMDLQKRIDDNEAERSKLIRPRLEDYTSDEAYDKAFDDYIRQKNDLKEQRESLENELYGYYNKMPVGGWKVVDLYRTARETSNEEMEHRREELREKRVKLIEKRQEIEKEQDKVRSRKVYNVAEMDAYAAGAKVAYDPPKRYEKQPTEDEIVARLAGGDRTKGSCASLGFCYIGQKNGIDVLDFRDGESRFMFSTGCRNTLRGIAAETGKPLKTESTKTGTGGAIKLARQCEEGKEYYFVTGRHAAIMRRKGENIEYMELQSGNQNGWKKLAKADDRAGLDYMFRWRFGSSRGITGEALMMDIDDMKDSLMLRRAYGYMNTAEDKQHKGAGGHER